MCAVSRQSTRMTITFHFLPLFYFIFSSHLDLSFEHGRSAEMKLTEPQVPQDIISNIIFFIAEVHFEFP
jgi:hypothetical protein